MEIRNNSYKRICDMGACRNAAEHCIAFENVAGRIDICRPCLVKLYKECKRVLYDKKGS